MATDSGFNWLARRQLGNALALAAEEHARGRLVDIGCGLKPYGPLFARFVTEHIGVDHPDSPHAATHVDVVASAYDVPLPDESFDTALMSEVLEHLEDPVGALREVQRLLRPGGTLLLTAPMFWVRHEEPRDFYRYAPHGLEYLLREAGFSSIAITPLSGQWGTLALLGSYAVRASPARRVGRPLERLVAGGQRLAARMDERSFNAWMSWNHLAVAHR